MVSMVPPAPAPGQNQPLPPASRRATMNIAHPGARETRTRPSVDKQSPGRAAMRPGRATWLRRETRGPMPRLIPAPQLGEVVRDQPAAGEHARDQARHEAGVPNALRGGVPGIRPQAERHHRPGTAHHRRRHGAEQRLPITRRRRPRREDTLTHVRTRQGKCQDCAVFRPRPLLPARHPRAPAIPARRHAKAREPHHPVAHALELTQRPGSERQAHAGIGHRPHREPRQPWVSTLRTTHSPGTLPPKAVHPADRKGNDLRLPLARCQRRLRASLGGSAGIRRRRLHCRAVARARSGARCGRTSTRPWPARPGTRC